jgi:tetratricopeptide (TPR) repeat protein
MKMKSSLLMFSLSLWLFGCASLQIGSEFQSGREALLKGQNETALAYFQSTAQKDPNYVWGTAYKQSVWSYLGRSEYALGRLPQARQTLEKALATKQDEDLTRLYLGLALARAGDQQRGLKEIEGGMRGIDQWLNYVNDAHRYTFGQYWDASRELRSSIQGDLAMISGREFDLQKLITSAEWLGKRFEEESDQARRDEARSINRESEGRGGNQP